MRENEVEQSCDPPWVMFPDIQPGELSRYLKQGVTEAWFDGHWRPFWTSLSEQHREEYLQHWNATADWRDAISFYFETDPDFDVEMDARSDSDQ